MDKRDKFSWVKYKKRHGVKHLGRKAYSVKKYAATGVEGSWAQILGVISACEGNFDTVISYDGTGVTFGFMQWTFTSGRLQRFLQYLKSIEVMDFTGDTASGVLFDTVCTDWVSDRQSFEDFGFKIDRGRFFDLASGKPLQPRTLAVRKRIDDICTGKTMCGTKVEQKAYMLKLAKIFAAIGRNEYVQDAQVEFARLELQRAMIVARKPLKGESIQELLASGGSMLYALFFTLWQNNPGAAYKLFKRARLLSKGSDMFAVAWKLANTSKFGNWGWGSGKNKSPRVIRIKKAFHDAYGLNLPYYKS